MLPSQGENVDRDIRSIHKVLHLRKTIMLGFALFLISALALLTNAASTIPRTEFNLYVSMNSCLASMYNQRISLLPNSSENSLINK